MHVVLSEFLWLDRTFRFVFISCLFRPSIYTNRDQHKHHRCWSTFNRVCVFRLRWSWPLVKLTIKLLFGSQYSAAFIQLLSVVLSSFLITALITAGLSRFSFVPQARGESVGIASLLLSAG